MKKLSVKKLLVLILCAITALLMISCGGNTSSPASNSDSTDTPSSESASNTESKGSYSFVIGAGHGPAGFPYVSCATDVLEPEIIKRAAELGYDVTFTEGFGGTIAPLADVFEATGSGLMDFGLFGTTFEPSKALVLNYSNYLPFGPTDPGVAFEVSNMLYDANKEAIDNSLAPYNIKYLGASGATANYDLLTTKEVKNMDDLKGVKVAAAGSNLNLLQNTGAVGVPSNLNEAYTSLQTGVYDGWIVFPGGVMANNLNEVAQYYLKTGFGSGNTLVVLMNLDTFDSLPQELQDIIQDVVRNVYGPACVQRINEEQEAASNIMETSGVTITELSEADREKWINAIPDPAFDAIEEFNKAGLPGEKMFSEYYQFAEELGYTAPRRFGQ
jgi:TRAP-type C4-dicarboxylate transport system substrate-binding protein